MEQRWRGWKLSPQHDEQQLQPETALASFPDADAGGSKINIIDESTRNNSCFPLLDSYSGHLLLVAYHIIHSRDHVTPKPGHQRRQRRLQGKNCPQTLRCLLSMLMSIRTRRSLRLCALPTLLPPEVCTILASISIPVLTLSSCLRCHSYRKLSAETTILGLLLTYSYQSLGPRGMDKMVCISDIHICLRKSLTMTTDPNRQGRDHYRKTTRNTAPTSLDPVLIARIRPTMATPCCATCPSCTPPQRCSSTSQTLKILRLVMELLQSSLLLDLSSVPLSACSKRVSTLPSSPTRSNAPQSTPSRSSLQSPSLSTFPTGRPSSRPLQLRSPPRLSHKNPSSPPWPSTRSSESSTPRLPTTST